MQHKLSVQNSYYTIYPTKMICFWCKIVNTVLTNIPIIVSLPNLIKVPSILYSVMFCNSDSHLWHYLLPEIYLTYRMFEDLLIFPSFDNCQCIIRFLSIFFSPRQVLKWVSKVKRLAQCSCVIGVFGLIVATQVSCSKHLSIHHMY